MIGLQPLFECLRIVVSTPLFATGDRFLRARGDSPYQIVRHHLQLNDQIQFLVAGAKHLVEGDCLRDRSRKSVKSRPKQYTFWAVIKRSYRLGLRRVAV